MKYLQKLFASSNNQQESSFDASPASAASKLYSVTFVAKQISTSSLSQESASSQLVDNERSCQENASLQNYSTQTTKTNTQQTTTTTTTTTTTNKSSPQESIDLTQVSISFQGVSNSVRLSNRKIQESCVQFEDLELNSHNQRSVEIQKNNYKVTSDSSHQSDISRIIDEEDDWVIIGELSSSCQKTSSEKTEQVVVNLPLKAEEADKRSVNHQKVERTIKIWKMSLGKKDIELIQASWAPAKKDSTTAGILLFKGLFTKFPEYLKFFPAFSDLNLENMRDNKRLLRHAVKVIETVSFVVEAVADEKLANQLSDALVNLVRSHLKRNIGLKEFKNLGVVLIDFICEINNKRQLEHNPDSSCKISQEEDNSDTMTSALDKLDNSTNAASSSVSSTNDLADDMPSPVTKLENHNHEIEDDSMSSIGTSLVKLDAGELVGAWTKLYASILSLVEREEAMSEK